MIVTIRAFPTLAIVAAIFGLIGHAAAQQGALASPLLAEELERLVRGYLRERTRAGAKA